MRAALTAVLRAQLATHRNLRALARGSLRRFRRVLGVLPGDYTLRMRREQAYYAGRADVHELPRIFHYWSNRYLRPKLEPFGFAHPDAFFARYVARALHGRSHGEAVIASVGAGNCDSEIRLAQSLAREGFRAFAIECIDVNAPMLERGRRHAAEAGVESHLRFTEADFNRWSPRRRYDAIIANQSLHHVLALEHLFDAIRGPRTVGTFRDLRHDRTQRPSTLARGACDR